MEYKYIDKSKSKLFIVLHGTGGNENSFIPLANFIDPETSILGLRGNVNESGLNRFFKRLRPGVFDIENLMEETKKLKTFIDSFIEEKGYKPQNIYLLGYSNGANILASLLYHFGKAYGPIALMHPMIPLRNFKLANQNNQKIIITSGLNDPMVSVNETDELVKILVENGADVTHKVYKFEHDISDAEIIDVKSWFNKQEAQ